MKACVFDCETTGLLLPSVAPVDKQPRIIELGAMIVDTITGEIEGELSQLIDPGVPISPEITKITKLSSFDLKGKPTFKEFVRPLSVFFSRAEMLIAHNAPFDSGMLRSELAIAGCEWFKWPTEIICTVQEYTPMFGFKPSIKVLHEKILGRELAQTHRALDDVRALYEILKADKFFEKIGVA